jgi:hypothetical protein
MKPNFALSLSFEGIKLLHRAAGGWREIGEVSVTSEDLASELAVLRKTAASLEPGGVRTKLVIPAGQIKYLTIETMGLSDAARRKEAEMALENATPYDVSELAYDICMDGAKTHVAAVARETLAEAEAFATEHRFHPVSFVAVPGDAPYLGEPFFGPIEGVAALLGPDETVEPDGIAVVIVGSTLPPADEPQAAQAAAAPPKVAPETMVEPAAKPQTDLKSSPEKAQPFEKSGQDAKETPDQAAASQPKPAAPIAPSAPEARAKETAKVADAPKPPSDAQPQLELPAQKPEPVKADPTKTPEAEPLIAKAAPEKPTEKAVIPDAGSATPAPSAKTADTSTPVPSPVAPVTAAPKPAPRPTTINPTPAATSGTADAGAPDAGPGGFASRRNATAPGTKPVGGVQRIAVNTPRPDSSSLNKPAPPVESAAPAKSDTPVSASSRLKNVFLSRRKPRVGAAAPLAAPSVAVPATGTESERMTVFGARAQQVGGKPRFLGLVMTVILLVFLAGVAAWAAVFLDEGIAGLLRDDKGRATASAPENQIDPEIIRTPDGMDTAQADGGDAVQIAALDPVLSAEDGAVLDAMQDARREPETPVITEAEAAARYAVSGIWPLAPEVPLSDGDTPVLPVYRSGIDPVSTASDALALPAPDQFETDVQLAAVVSPPPFGQTTSLDAQGRIIPTPEGVVTPEGYTLVAASPPMKPPAAIIRSEEPDAPEAAPDTTATLVAFRPQNRPLGLSERTERAQLGGVTLNELAVFRPALRPDSVQDRARQAQEAQEAAEEAVNVATSQAAANAAAAAAAASALVVPQPVVAALAPAIQNATPLATPQSQRPDTRPRNFDRIVNRAQQAAPAQETRVAAATSVAPRTVAPSIPSSTTVARSATLPNAINLRRINLIGVYGKPDSRRALVRLSNGRYQKVQVGDRIDGGRVAAIGNTELRYTKGGRNVVLQIP